VGVFEKGVLKKGGLPSGGEYEQTAQIGRKETGQNQRQSHVIMGTVTVLGGDKETRNNLLLIGFGATEGKPRLNELFCSR